MSIAVVFPGQGSQFVGMGAELPKALFDEADALLGYKLSDIMFNGTDDVLKQTENTQPALLTHSLALWALLSERVTPAYFAGHSLGEYCAITAAGGFTFAEAVVTVRHRGQLMQTAMPAGVGGMAAVLGADDSVVEAVCAEVSAGGSSVEPANYNCNGQLVVSGHLDALERFAPVMKERGAKRVIPLAVSGAFHSSLMLPAQISMEKYLNDVKINTLHTPVINNVDAAIESEPAVVRSALVRQISGAVRWTQSIEKLISLGVDHFIEVGPGAVLTGLIKKIDKNVKCENVATLDDINRY